MAQFISPDEFVGKFSCIQRDFKSHDMYVAHEGIKRSFPEVEYYSWYHYGEMPALLLSRFEGVLTDNNWNIFKINGILYESMGSNGIEYFEQFRRSDDAPVIEESSDFRMRMVF